MHQRVSLGRSRVFASRDSGRGLQSVADSALYLPGRSENWDRAAILRVIAMPSGWRRRGISLVSRTPSLSSRPSEALMQLPPGYGGPACCFLTRLLGCLALAGGSGPTAVSGD